MNRCLPTATARFLILLMLGLAGASLFSPRFAQAQTMGRQFPPAALRGMLIVTAPPDVLINGTAARLSPGARIKGTSNGLVMSASLAGQRVLVNYVRNAQGLIHEVWILSEQEALEKRAGMEMVTNFVFASDANQAKTDDGTTPFNQLPSYSGK